MECLGGDLDRSGGFTDLTFYVGLVAGFRLLGLPFDWYATFHIEEKYGFNKTTMKTYGLDLLKGMLVSGVIGGLLLSAVVWFMNGLVLSFGCMPGE